MRNPLRGAAFVASLVGLISCRSTTSSDPASTPSSGPPSSPPAHADAAKGQVVLGETAGWRADLVLDQGSVGIWTVKSFKVFPQYGTPEIVGLDDLGRCHVLWSYSGKWTPVTTIADGVWLGGLDVGDVDPRVPGRELYTGGKSGNVYEVVSHPDGILDNRKIASLGRREVHTLVVADAIAAHAGDELVAFTSPGGLYVLAPRADADGFETLLHEELEGRVRDAVVLPRAPGAPLEIATVSRSGAVEILRFEAGGPRWSLVHDLAMGRGRIALRAAKSGAPTVLYSTADDGTVWRHEQASGAAWRNELVYAGPQGPRGLAAGRFGANADEETIVVFGYSSEVELLTRGASGWKRETIFVDREKGHWIAAAEVDGRNATEEMVCSGYGGRVVLLSRPAGFGLGSVLARPSPVEAPAEGTPTR